MSKIRFEVAVVDLEIGVEFVELVSGRDLRPEKIDGRREFC